MSILIVTCGATGVTDKAGHMLKDLLENAEVVDGKSKSVYDKMNSCDKIVLGTNVHFGKFNKHFIKLTKEVGSKPLYVFICGVEIERKDHYIELMRELVPSAKEIFYIWGELNSKGVGFFKRFAIESFISGRKSDGLPVPRILDKELRALARLLNK